MHQRTPARRKSLHDRTIAKWRSLLPYAEMWYIPQHRHHIIFWYCFSWSSITRTLLHFNKCWKYSINTPKISHLCCESFSGRVSSGPLTPNFPHRKKWKNLLIERFWLWLERLHSENRINIFLSDEKLKWKRTSVHQILMESELVCSLFDNCVVRDHADKLVLKEA